MSQKINITMAEVRATARMNVQLLIEESHAFGLRLLPSATLKIIGVPRGGFVPALEFARAVEELIGCKTKIVDDYSNADIIVDDIRASGTTADSLAATYQVPVITLFDLKDYPEGTWLIFPWEGTAEASAEDIPLRMLQFIGEDPERDGLKDTPRRMIKAWGEIFSGYAKKPSDVLGVLFDNDGAYDEMVTLRDIEFYSMCEHHCLPFFGKVHVAYIPSANGKVIGISKLARLVDIFAKRMQIQERFTMQIAQALISALSVCEGVAVYVEAEHLCMKMRGVEKQNSKMVTTAMLGKFRDSSAAREEFLSIVRK